MGEMPESTHHDWIQHIICTGLKNGDFLKNVFIYYKSQINIQYTYIFTTYLNICHICSWVNCAVQLVTADH